MPAHDPNLPKPIPEQPKVTIADIMAPPSGVPVKGDKYAVMPISAPAFESQRLLVFHFRVDVPDAFSPRPHIFVAYRKDFRRGPIIAVTATIQFLPAGRGMFTASCGWIETSTEFRQQGLATELYDGIERYTGWTIDTTGTFAAFEKSIAAARERRTAR